MRLKNCDKCYIQRSELHLQLGSQSSTGNMCHGYQKKSYIFRSVIVNNKYLSNQCNLPDQIEQVEDRIH